MSYASQAKNCPQVLLFLPLPVSELALGVLKNFFNIFITSAKAAEIFKCMAGDNCSPLQALQHKRYMEIVNSVKKNSGHWHKQKQHETKKDKNCQTF